MVDRRGIIDKTLRGGRYDGADAATVVEQASGLLPGAGQLVQVGLSPVAEGMRANRDLAWIAENFGVASVERAAATDPLFKQELEHVDERITHALASSAAGAAGGLAGGWAGAAIGTAIAPGIGTTVGGLVGMGAAAMGGSYAVDALLDSPRTDAFAVLGDIQNDLAQGQPASAEKVFVVLASALPKEAMPRHESGKNYIVEKLEKLSKGKYHSLQQALADGRNDLLQALMRDSHIDGVIKSYNGIIHLPPEPGYPNQRPDVTAAELFAEKINAGVDPRVLVLRQKRMHLADMINQERILGSRNPGISGGDEVSAPDGNPLPEMDAGAGRRDTDRQR